MPSAEPIIPEVLHAGKGKLACWKIFKEANEDIITKQGTLGLTETPTADTEAAIEKFVCQLYFPKTTMTEVIRELRWWLLRKKQAQSERLLPTQAALHEALLRAHYQEMVWPRKLWLGKERRQMAACDD